MLLNFLAFISKLMRIITIVFLYVTYYQIIIIFLSTALSYLYHFQTVDRYHNWTSSCLLLTHYH